MTETPYEVVVGLEVHVQLRTRSKLFCRCGTTFGAPPNTQTCPVCIGLPGAMPVMNGEAVQLSLKTAIALNCEIPAFTKWDRKNYFYPDLPKGYQISQFDLPLSQDGFLAIHDPKGRFAAKRIGIKFNQDWRPGKQVLFEDQYQQLVSERVTRATLRLLRERTDAFSS